MVKSKEGVIMSKNVLVALDNSSYAEKVMLQAIEIAKFYNTPLLGISVIEDAYLRDCDESDSYACMTRDYWSASLQAVADKCKILADKNNIDLFYEVRNGNPAEQILKYADEKGAELIILGHLGKTAAAGFLLGSVAQKVAAYAKCSVFIVK